MKNEATNEKTLLITALKLVLENLKVQCLALKEHSKKGEKHIKDIKSLPKLILKLESLNDFIDEMCEVHVLQLDFTKVTYLSLLSETRHKPSEDQPSQVNSSEESNDEYDYFDTFSAKIEDNPEDFAARFYGQDAPAEDEQFRTIFLDLSKDKNNMKQ